MSLFICAKCGCVDNTACSGYWSMITSKNLHYTEKLKEYKGKPLCSECGKIIFAEEIDKLVVIPGSWHNKFEKKQAADAQIDRCNKNTYII